jgi:heavy metal translocating P-type ATPase
VAWLLDLGSLLHHSVYLPIRTTGSLSVNRTPREINCAYCGLPVSSRRSSVTSTDESTTSGTGGAEEYCCLGCRFAAAVTQEKGEIGQARWTLTRLGLSIFFTMNVMVFTMALWSWDVYDIGGGQELASFLRQLFRQLCFVCALPVLLMLGVPLLQSAWGTIRRGELTTDLLLATGVVAAFAYSVISLWQGATHVYFEVSCMVLVAVTLGRWLEATGKIKTTSALEALQQLLPERARVVDSASGAATEVALHEVQPGMLLHVLAGQRIPTDGRITRYATTVDEQIITGESRPRSKQIGDTVYGGSLVVDSDTYIEATSRPNDGTLQRIVELVRTAARQKSAHVRFADRCVHYFTPFLFAATLATFYWHTRAAGFQQGLMASLSVVLIACPCALGIATPLALWAGIGRAARGQVLFRDGDTLDAFAQIDTVFLDKTGTLSTGTLVLIEQQWQPGIPPELKSSVRGIASRSVHPVARAVSDALQDVPLPERLGPVLHHPGQGLSCDVTELGDTVYLGSKTWMEQLNCSLTDFQADTAASITQDSSTADSGTTAWVAWRGRVQGRFQFSEQLRPEASDALQRLRQDHLAIEVLTGDSSRYGQSLAEELQVQVHAELMPSDKQEHLKRAMRAGRRVAMVGDGVNDAPALATATVGIAMGCGADASRDAAGICLLGDDLRRIGWTLELARHTRRTVRQNLVWAFAYNLIGVALAMGGLLNPIFAAAAMLGSSLLVIGNSLRLSGFPDLAPENDQPLSPADTPCPPSESFSRDRRDSINSADSHHASNPTYAGTSR